MSGLLGLFRGRRSRDVFDKPAAGNPGEEAQEQPALQGAVMPGSIGLGIDPEILLEMGLIIPVDDAPRGDTVCLGDVYYRHAEPLNLFITELRARQTKLEAKQKAARNLEEARAILVECGPDAERHLRAFYKTHPYSEEAIKLLAGVDSDLSSRLLLEIFELEISLVRQPSSLEDLLNDSGRDRLVDEALKALIPRMGGPIESDVVGAFINLVRENSRDAIRFFKSLKMMEILGESGDPQAIEVLCKVSSCLIAGRDPRIQFVLKGFESDGSPKAEASLLRLSRSEETAAEDQPGTLSEAIMDQAAWGRLEFVYFHGGKKLSAGVIDAVLNLEKPQRTAKLLDLLAMEKGKEFESYESSEAILAISPYLRDPEVAERLQEMEHQGSETWRRQLASARVTVYLEAVSASV